MKHKLTIENEYLYKKFRNRAANELKASCKLYYHKFFAEHKSKMKTLWSGIRSIINLRQNDSTRFSQLIVDGKNANPSCTEGGVEMTPNGFSKIILFRMNQN